MDIGTFAEMESMNGDATRPGFQPSKPSSTRKYKWLTLLFGFLNVLWIILLIYMVKELNRPEESCNSKETHQTETRAEKMCLPCSYLRDASRPCCTENLQVWRRYVTEFVNVEFAKSKRNPEERARTKRSVSGLPNTQRTRAVDDEAYYRKRRQEGVNVLRSIEIMESGSYIVTAEVTLDFPNSNTSPKASCSIVRRRRGETFVLFKETVSACFLKNPKETCKAPISIGGNSLLEVNDTVYLEIDQMPGYANATTQILVVV